MAEKTCGDVLFTHLRSPLFLTYPDRCDNIAAMGLCVFRCVASATHFLILEKEGHTMEPWMVILGIVALVVGIVIARYIANCFYEIACMKGFYEKCYFWIPFFGELLDTCL